MKLSELKNLTNFLSILFKFFKDKNIQSSLQQVNDFDLLLERILNSEFLSFNFNPGIEHYGINFKLDTKIEVSEIYMFLFGKNENNESTSLLIDLGENELKSFFSFSWHQVILPPFISDFKKDGTDEIMTLEDFKIFLEANKEQKNLTWVEVD